MYDDEIGKVSLIGAGMRSHPGITAKFFAALANAGVNIEMISTSEIRISVIVDEADVAAAVQATHTAFDLDSAEVEAVVYGGTGTMTPRRLHVGCRRRHRAGRRRDAPDPARARLPDRLGPLLLLGALRRHRAARSATARSPWRTPTAADPSGLDLALFSAGATASRALAPRFAAAG